MLRFAALQLDWCTSSQRTVGLGWSPNVTEALDFKPPPGEADPKQTILRLASVGVTVTTIV